jgi:hypothetical protein
MSHEVWSDRPLSSAESEWLDNWGFAQAVLDNPHDAARKRIDEVRLRAANAPSTYGDFHTLGRAELERLADVTRWRPAIDYRAAVRDAARQLGLGDEGFDAIRELASRDGYKLAKPRLTARAPAPAVASKMGADRNGLPYWGSGTVANRQARQRYLETIASEPLRFRFANAKDVT